MGDEMTDEDSIRAAFMAAYRDLANHGLVRSDEKKSPTSCFSSSSETSKAASFPSFED